MTASWPIAVSLSLFFGACYARLVPSTKVASFPLLMWGVIFTACVVLSVFKRFKLRMKCGGLNALQR